MTLEPSPFAVDTIRSGNGTARIVVQGELDLATAPRLDDELERRITPGAEVVLDLSQTAFIDSTGLSSIVSAMRIAEDVGATFTMSSAIPAQVRRVLELAGLTGMLPICAE